MVAIEVEFLTGRFSATAHNDREEPEWPPHPARLFSAMVAAWADAEEPDLVERSALEWLEAQPPPEIAAPEAFPRSPMTHFVPVNDASVVGTSSYRRRADSIIEIEDAIDTALEASGGEIDKKVMRLQEKLLKARSVKNMVEPPGNTNPKDAAQLLPEHRNRQPRVFPSVTLSDPRVTYQWGSDAEPAVTKALDSILERVTRVGHSSSLVSCRLVEEAPEPTWRPGRGDSRLRAVRRGQLQALEAAYRDHRGCKPRSLPFVAVPYGTSVVDEDSPEPARPTNSGEWLVFPFRENSRRFPATRTVDIARVMRDAVFHHASGDLPEGLTGHSVDGSPTQKPHVSFLPLPYVGFEHSDGRIMGLAIMIPHSADTQTRQALFRAVGNWEATEERLRLTLGKSGIIDMERAARPTMKSLNRGIWDKRSATWTTVTPVALPSHPGGLSHGSAAARQKAWAKAEQAIAASCAHVGLPKPSRVVASLNGFMSGLVGAPAYPAFLQPGCGGLPVARQLVHAWIEFDTPVTGPVVLGSGRYFGLGLLRPVERRKEDE